MQHGHPFIDDYRLASLVLDVLRQVLKAARGRRGVDRDLLRELWYWVHVVPEDEGVQGFLTKLRDVLLENGGLVLQPRSLPRLEQVAEELATWVLAYAEGSSRAR